MTSTPLHKLLCAATWSALAGAAVLAGCARNPADDPRAVTRARIQAENAIAVLAYEPKSIVFRNERVLFRKRRPIVCGEFDGRNRLHEFAGFTRFIVEGDEALTDDKRPEFQQRWAEACAEG